MTLCYWSTIYDQVFEHPECPSEEVIFDNKRLDKWFEDQIKEVESERRKRKSKKGKMKSASDHGDYITFGRN